MKDKYGRNEMAEEVEIPVLTIKEHDELAHRCGLTPPELREKYLTEGRNPCKACEYAAECLGAHAVPDEPLHGAKRSWSL